MAYPGPWTQGSDYTRDQGTYIKRGMTGTRQETSVGGPPYDLAMNSVLDATGVSTSAAVGLSGEVAVSATTEHPDGSVDWVTEKGTGGGEWTADGLLGAGWYYNNVLAPTRPADAIGYEFEAPNSTIAGATLRLVVSPGGAGDASIPQGNSAVPQASIAVDIVGGDTYANAGVLLMSYRAPTPGFTSDLDMTPFVGPLGECAVALNVNKTSQWGYYDGSHPALINASTSANTGATASRVIYTLHPPRHRWLYATPQPLPTIGIPPLRTVQRGGDGRGASSAPRAVQHQTRQATNRAVGCF